jgi:hypothetical protein
MAEFWAQSHGPEPISGPVDPHLTDAQLHGTADQRAIKHLDGCALCRLRSERTVAATHSVPGGPLDPFDDDDAFADRLDGLLRSGTVRSTHVVPTGAWALLSDAAPTTAVSAGDMWQLALGEHTSLVAVLHVDGWWVDVAPVTLDVPFADQYSLLLGSADTSLGVPAAVMTALRTGVPLYTFAQYLGGIRLPASDSPGAHSSALGALKALDVAARQQTEVPHDLPTGRSNFSLSVDVREYYDEIRQSLTPFSAAVPAGAAAAETAPADWREQIRALSKDDLDTVGVRQADLLPVVRGDVAIPRLVADRIAALLGLSSETLLAASYGEPSAALVALVSEPARRPKVLRWAQHNRPDDDYAEVPWILARQVMATAARTIASTINPTSQDRAAWLGRLELILGEPGPAEQ